MVKGRFYSRKQGWINIDTDVKRMRVYTSQAIEITEEYMKKIHGLSAEMILKQHIPYPILNQYAKIFKRWIWYKDNTDIGCFTRL